MPPPFYPTDLAGTAASSGASAGQAAASQLPGYMTSMQNIGTNIASETAGQVPADVINELRQQAAETNTSTGGGTNAGYLKALGLTSLGLMQEGQRNLEEILPSTPGYTLSQNPEFQTSSNLAYEKQLQQQIFQMQQEEQQKALLQQQAALKTAQQGAAVGGSSYSPPTPGPRIGSSPPVTSGASDFGSSPILYGLGGGEKNFPNTDAYSAWSAANPWASPGAPAWDNPDMPAIPAGTPLTLPPGVTVDMLSDPQNEGLTAQQIADAMTPASDTVE